MTFFLMRNRFQQPKDQVEENVTSKAKAALTSGAGTLLNSLFGASKQRSSSATRKASHHSDKSSSNSRASSVGRSEAYPPKRISFDEDDFDGSGAKSRPVRAAQPTQRSYGGPSAGQEKGDEQSSGTTDPPDELPDENVEDERECNSTTSDHGSDTSGPDSPEEVHLDDDLVLFMRQFVEQIFLNGHTIDQDDKNKFGEYARTESGRLWFARFVNSQRVNYGNKLDEAVFYRLVQFTAIVLFECYQEEDYGPAKTLMNICFTFYKEGSQGSARKSRREFLYHYLRKQAIWHSLKFWNAAYFDATQSERARRAQREEWSGAQDDSHTQSYSGAESNQSAQDDFVYRTLGDFINNMRAFHVAKDSVLEFLRKQSHTLSPEQLRTLRERIEAMFS